MTFVRLAEIAHARSGDKGNHANVGVIAYTSAGFAFLGGYLTEARMAEYLLPLRPRQVERLSAKLWPLARNRCGVIAKCCPCLMVLNLFHSAKAGHRCFGSSDLVAQPGYHSFGSKTNHRIRRRVSKRAACL